ncbi:MAG TPA: CBS and ACT domain-containing protein [Anaerolineae bacterium]|nr:CBS and ACT domain-containing protein [Anaerolineae bacterium]HOQ98253.1 CBS and ACT domain-containing protein [Anaerolineae bacterium]HPL28655.1 CBS and ACT domain-containing protein [Anaerolineae bacterium]
MLVKARMTPNPVTVHEDTSMHEALRLMRERKVRRLPVLDTAGKLVGMVSEKDLLYASPSPATSLSTFEINYLIAQIKVAQLMSKTLITVGEDTPLEEAARIMVDNKVGGLPVLDTAGNLVGIITETDLFRIFLELLGARERGLRLTLLVPDKRGMLASLAGAVAGLDGDILALGTFSSQQPGQALLAMKVRDVDRQALLDALRTLGIEVVDVREA